MLNCKNMPTGKHKLARKQDAHRSVIEKVRGIFSELAGEESRHLDGDAVASRAISNITEGAYAAIRNTDGRRDWLSDGRLERRCGIHGRVASISRVVLGR